jgi:hypothetical protein
MTQLASSLWPIGIKTYDIWVSIHLERSLCLHYWPLDYNFHTVVSSRQNLRFAALVRDYSRLVDDWPSPSYGPLPTRLPCHSHFPIFDTRVPSASSNAKGPFESCHSISPFQFNSISRQMKLDQPAIGCNWMQLDAIGMCGAAVGMQLASNRDLSETIIRTSMDNPTYSHHLSSHHGLPLKSRAVPPSHGRPSGSLWHAAHVDFNSSFSSSRNQQKEAAYECTPHGQRPAFAI